jgi:putative spermidine/putrescine transport system permease protein
VPDWRAGLPLSGTIANCEGAARYDVPVVAAVDADDRARLCVAFFLSWLGVGVSFTALLITHTVVCLPYIVRTSAGVYAGIPPAYEEAAAILGASPMQVLWHVTLPLIRPGIMAGSLFSFLTSFDNLPISYFFGSARTNTLPVVMLSYLENQFDPTIAALSTLQLIMAIVMLLIVNRIYGVEKMTVAG